MASAGWSSVSPDTVGGPGVYGSMLTAMTDGYEANPEGIGTWCFQVVFDTYGTVRRRMRVNGELWTDWA